MWVSPFACRRLHRGLREQPGWLGGQPPPHLPACSQPHARPPARPPQAQPFYSQGINDGPGPGAGLPEAPLEFAHRGRTDTAAARRAAYAASLGPERFARLLERVEAAYQQVRGSLGTWQRRAALEQQQWWWWWWLPAGRRVHAPCCAIASALQLPHPTRSPLADASRYAAPRDATPHHANPNQLPSRVPPTLPVIPPRPCCSCAASRRWCRCCGRPRRSPTSSSRRTACAPSRSSTPCSRPPSWETCSRCGAVGQAGGRRLWYGPGQGRVPGLWDLGCGV